MHGRLMMMGLLVLWPGVFGCESTGILSRLPSPFSPRGERSYQQTNFVPQPVYNAPVDASPSRSKENLSGAVIVIDPGHGGRDPGAHGVSRMYEEDIVLDIANKTVAELRRRGARVIPTRTADRALAPTKKADLAKRAQLAENSHADLFVSIHADAATNRRANGVGVHHYTEACLESKQAARHMLNAFSAAGVPHWGKGIFLSNLYVLREHSRPSLLVECGYLTNASDAKKLNSSSYRTKIADAIVDGIARYITQ